VTAVVDGHRLVCILAGRTSSLSTSDSRLFVALGAANLADRLEFRWPSGASQEWIDVEADRFLEAREGSATLRPRVGRNGLICPQESSVRQGSTCNEKLRSRNRRIIVPPVEHRPQLEVRAESQGPSQGNREEDFSATDETRMEHG